MLVTAGTAHATDGYFLNGIGAASKGAGGVAIALPQDALSITANPANAIELGHRLDAGLEIFVPSRGASISGNGAGLNGSYSGNGANPFVLPEMAYVRPLSDSISVGIALNGNGGMNTTYKRNPFAAFGATGDAGVDLKQIFVTPTIAARIAPGHSVGLSPIIVFQTFHVHGIQPFATASSDPSRFTNRGHEHSAGAGVRVGYLGSFGERVRVGAFYQSKINTGRFENYAGLFADRGGFDVPASWGAGLSVAASDKLTLAGDFKRIEYSDVGSVGNPLARLFQGIPFGAEGGPGFGWRDISVYKAGAVYKASENLTLRAGYGRSGNPVPRSETFLNILAPGVVRDHFTAGATIRANAGLEITGYVLHAPTNHVRGQGSIPANFGGGEADIRLAETALGVSFGLAF
ncbi:MAG: porin [Novosphingobium sp.]|nr:porin [Novosphingobium sp.]